MIKVIKVFILGIMIDVQSELNFLSLMVYFDMVYVDLLQALHDGHDVFFMVQVDGVYVYSKGYGLVGNIYLHD